MKNKFILLALGASLSTTLFAQEVNNQNNVQLPPDSVLLQLAADSVATPKFVADPQQVENYLRLYVKAGYAAMFDNIGVVDKSGTATDLSNKMLLGGPGAGIGFGYDLEYKLFRFSTGVEFNYLRSTSKYAFDVLRPNMIITQNGTDIPMDYTYRFGYLNETRNLMHVGIPILVGMQFDRWFFMVGARGGYNLTANATTKGDYDVTAFDKTLIQTLGNDPALGLQTYQLDPSKHKIALKQPEVSVLAEFGVDLDEWLQYKPKKKRRGRNAKPTFRESLHYKVSAFAEYSILNSNATAVDGNLAKFNGVPISEVNTVFAMPTTGGSAANLNNLFVGVKFAIQYQLPHKKPVVPPVKKPRTVKHREEHARQAVTAKLNGIVYNAETTLPLQADIILTDSIGQQVFSGSSDSLKGVFKTDLPAGKYHAVINKQGYLPFEEDVEFSLEALQFFIQPVKKGNTYVIRNLYFDTNLTTIQERSEESLNELFTFLNENKNIRIKLIGHTDAVGKDEDNQKLSEGRAESVRQAMIERGIDEGRIEAEGRGESEPIDTNDTEEGRQRNRRVMVEILDTIDGADAEATDVKVVQ